MKNYGCNNVLLHDVLGEPDDDREELIAAANFACNASCMFLKSTLYCVVDNLIYIYIYICTKVLFALSDRACSSPFWKQMQSIFAPVSLEETSYLKEQVDVGTKIFKMFFVISI